MPAEKVVAQSLRPSTRRRNVLVECREQSVEFEAGGGGEDGGKR